MTVTKNDEKKSEKIVDYDGAFDENLMRKGYGKEVHKRKPGNEYYEGNFNNDAYHGLGYYKNDSIFYNKWTYEGSFFSNAKEGYGLLSLPDNIYFEGLYENDRPFGPGILTRSNGEQDVGFWQSSSIVRLIQPILGEVEELSTTPTNKAFMTKFKNLVEVAPPNTVALQVAKDMNLPEEVAPKLYSIYCKDPRNFLFNYEQFEQEHFSDLRKMEDLLPVLSEDDFSISTTAAEISEVEHPMGGHYGEMTFNSWSHNSSPAQNEVTETEMNLCWDRLRKRINLLLAWNNTPIMIDIMVHTFINRIYEKMAGFKVVDIICNNRQQFREPGPLEQACRGLLESSNSGNLREFTWLLFANKLNINLQDSKGNGCVIRAASQDRHALLYLLFLYGADMNIENDEGFTALNHTIARYLGLLHSVRDWGKAFLPPLAAKINPVKARIWRKCSVASMITRSPKVSDRRGSKRKLSSIKVSTESRRKTTIESKGFYIFDLSPTDKPGRTRRKQTMTKKERHRKGTTPTKSSRRTESEVYHPDTNNTEQEALKKQKLEDVRQTLELLLTFKINPNISRVPQPAIILAIFSGDYNLVKMLLEAGANPNARFLPEEGWLTPLHILCLAKPHHTFPKIMDILLEYGADPNAQASVDFAPKTKEFVLHGNSEMNFQIMGLTPLQALLLRADGSQVPGKEILKELVLKLHDITANNPKYFGHSFLSMAVIRMNLAFIFTLLHIFGEDPNEYLHPQWGNVATAYLKYLGRTKDPEAIITLIELEQAGLNPLRIVETWETNEEENVINCALKMANLNHSSKRKTTYGKRSTSAKRASEIPKRSSLAKRTSEIPKKSDETDHRKSISNKNKSDDITKKSTSNQRYSVEHRRQSSATQHSAGTRTSTVFDKSRGGKQRTEKELLKKITLLQDLGRDKVDKYIRGLVIRRLITYLRRKTNEGGVINQNDNTIQQAINWFYPTNFSIEEEFIRILTHNILAGLTFIGLQEVEQMFSIIPWERKELPLFSPRNTKHKDSLKHTDKVLLNQLKEAIKSQLDDGVSIDHLDLSKKKLKKSTASLKQRKNSQGSIKSMKSKSQISCSPDHKDKTSNHANMVKTSIESQKSEYQAVGPTDEDAVNQSPKESIEQNELIAQEIIEARRTEFIEKLQPLLIMCSPQVRWARHYGTKFIRMPKRATFNADLYPEVDKNPDLYRVCYKCVKRDSGLQLCPMCKMIWYCCSKCNIRDVMNLNSNHRCKADFYGRGIMWRHYGFDEDGNLLRIPREGQEDWEGEDMANDELIKKYGRKVIIGDNGINQDGIHRGRDFNAKFGGNRASRDGMSLTDKYGRDKGGKGKMGKRSHGSKAGTGDMRGSGRLAEEQGKRGEEGKWKNDIKREKAKARLKEKKELLLREAKQMRELRKKIPHGVMGDFMRWGFTVMQSVQERSWYKKQKNQGGEDVLGREDAPGATLSDEYLQLVHQLQVLQGLAALFGSKFDLNTLFPWVVLRDGELYYKFHSTSYVLENYSFN